MFYIVADKQTGAIEDAFMSLMNSIEQDGETPTKAAIVVYTDNRFFTTYVNMTRRDMGIVAADIQQDVVSAMIAEYDLECLDEAIEAIEEGLDGEEADD